MSRSAEISPLQTSGPVRRSRAAFRACRQRTRDHTRSPGGRRTGPVEVYSGAPSFCGRVMARAKERCGGRLSATTEAMAGQSVEYGLARVQQLMEATIRGMTREVIVVAGVVIAGPAAMVAKRAHDGQVMRLLRKIRQVLAQLDAGSGSCNGLEGASIFFRGIRLHVPGVDVRCAAAEPDHDGRFRRLARVGSPPVAARAARFIPK